MRTLIIAFVLLFSASVFAQNIPDNLLAEMRGRVPEVMTYKQVDDDTFLGIFFFEPNLLVVSYFFIAEDGRWWFSNQNILAIYRNDEKGEPQSIWELKVKS